MAPTSRDENLEFLTVAEVAALLRVTSRTVRSWIAAEKMVAVRAGRRDLLRVAAKRRDITLDPLQRRKLVHEAVVAGGLIGRFFEERWMMQKLQMASHAIGDIESLLQASGMADDRPPFSIRTYPREWVRQKHLAQIGTLTIRPIRPEDEPLYGRFLERIEPIDMRMRFFTAFPDLSHKLIARLTQIDYAREMAFVAIEARSGDLVGVARLVADPERNRAEFAVIVASDLKGRGLGYCLMQTLIEFARIEQIGELFGEVLAVNLRMLNMCREFGFEVTADSTDNQIRLVHLKII